MMQSGAAVDLCHQAVLERITHEPPSATTHSPHVPPHVAHPCLTTVARRARRAGIARASDVPVRTPEAISAQSLLLHNTDVPSKRPGLRVHPAKGRAIVFW